MLHEEVNHEFVPIPSGAPKAASLSFHLRLEDVVALLFFLFTLALHIIFRELRRENVTPADVLVVIPAVALLFAKEIVHYFLGSKETRLESPQDIVGFLRPYWEIVRDWFPFLVVLLMYYSLWGDATHLLVTTDRDTALRALDQRLFHFEPSLALQRIISPPLTAWMQFAYAFHIWNIPLVACFIYLRRSRPRFREMMCGMLVVSFFGLLGYLLVPAIGPIYTLRTEYTVALSQPLGVFNQEVEFMDFARIQRDVFPSLHVGISFLVWLYAYRNSKRLFWILSPLILSLWLSTLYLRYHYLIDCVAGLILAPLCFLLANWLFKRFGEIEGRMVVPAAVMNLLPGSWSDGIRRSRANIVPSAPLPAAAAGSPGAGAGLSPNVASPITDRDQP